MASGGEVGGKIRDIVESADLEQDVCQPCQEDGELREAVGLCTDCQKYLCQTCFDAHRLPKPSRTHKLLDKQQINSQTLLARKDRCTERCTQHEDKVVKYYCIIHSQLSCSICLNLNHRICKAVQYIPDVANDLTNNEEFKQAGIQLASILEKSKKAAKIVKQNSETFEANYKKALNMVKDFRQEINDVVDNIENKIIQQAETMKLKEMEKIGLVADKCKQAVEELQATLDKMETFRKSNQNCNLFTEMMKVNGQLNAMDKQMMDTEREQSAKTCEIQFTPNTEILDTLKQIELFGQLSVVETQLPDMGTQMKNIQARGSLSMTDTSTGEKAEHIQDINVHSGDDKKVCHITGSVILPDNRLVITDRNNNKIKSVDIKQGGVTAQLKLSSCPWDIAMINSNQVAVTLPNKKKVVFVTAAANMTQDRKLPVGGACCGVDYKDGKLAVSFPYTHQVKVLNLQGSVLYSITTDNQGKKIFCGPYYLAFANDSTALYVSCNESHNIVCVKLDGTVVASYTDSELRIPGKVVVDNSDKVYVCAEGSNSTHQLSHSCKKIRVMITKAQGLVRPCCVRYDNAENMLFVCIYNSSNIRVYKAVLETE